MIWHAHVENKSTHLSASQVDHIYIKSALRMDFRTKIIVQNIYFSDHNAERIVFYKNNVHFTITK